MNDKPATIYQNSIGSVLDEIGSQATAIKHFVRSIQIKRHYKCTNKKIVYILIRPEN